WVLHGITKDMVLDRMKIVKTAMQELWEFVEQVIDDSVAKGQIKQ
ncbi:MAG TPA: phosphohydrolase, partial [Clostridiales bacterium]|nr:phosphohydrolase [Clostridiales bacterium]